MSIQICRDTVRLASKTVTSSQLGLEVVLMCWIGSLPTTTDIVSIQFPLGHFKYVCIASLEPACCLILAYPSHLLGLCRN